MEWVWSDQKNRTSRRDHGLSFETAVMVFADPLALSRPDPHPDGERWQTVGVVGTIALFVVHTWPDPNPDTGQDIGRIISARKATSHEGKPMKMDNSDAVTALQSAELEALAAVPEDRIDTIDIPEQRDWSEARRGVFFRPVKKQLTLRLDADVIDWFKTHTPSGEGYQTLINSALRDYVARQQHR